MLTIQPLQSNQQTNQPVQEWGMLIHQLDTLNRRIQGTFEHFRSEYDWQELRDLTISVNQMDRLVSETLPPMWKFWESIFRFIPNTQSYAIWSRTVSMHAIFSSLKSGIKRNIKTCVLNELRSGEVCKSTIEIMNCFLKIVPSSSIYRYLGMSNQKNGIDSQREYERAFYHKNCEKNLTPLLKILIEKREISRASQLIRDHKTLLTSCESKLLEIEVLCRRGEYPKAITLCWDGITGAYGVERDSFVHKLVDTFILQSENLAPEVLEDSLREILSCFANKTIYTHPLDRSDDMLMVAFDAFDYILKKCERGIDLFRSVLAFSSFEQRPIQLFVHFVTERVDVLKSQPRRKEQLGYIERFQKVLIPAIAFFQEHREYSSETFRPGPDLARCYNELSILKRDIQ